MDPDAIERCLCTLAVALEACNSVSQNVVQFGNSVLDDSIEPLQLVGGIGDLAMESRGALVDLCGFFGSAGEGGSQDCIQAVRRVQAPRQMSTIKLSRVSGASTAGSGRHPHHH